MGFLYLRHNNCILALNCWLTSTSPWEKAVEPEVKVVPKVKKDVYTCYYEKPQELQRKKFKVVAVTREGGNEGNRMGKKLYQFTMTPELQKEVGE